MVPGTSVGEVIAFADIVLMRRRRTVRQLHERCVALVAASLAAIADQSDKFVSAHEIIGLHEIPSFVADRVELTPGLSADRLEPTPGLSVDGPAADAGPRPIGGPAPADPPTGNRMGQS